MLARRHRLALHAAAAVLLSGVAVLATSIGAAADSKPGSYGADATASAVNFSINRNPPLFPAVQDPIHPQLSYAESQIDSSGGADGLSSSIYPGQTVTGLPALLCEFGGAQFCSAVISKLPDYPFQAHAQYPSQPDSTAMTTPPVPLNAGPLALTPHTLTAHASPDRVTADAVTDGSAFTGVFSDESAAAHTVESFAGGALVVTTQSVVRGVTIGGVVHIDQVTTTATGKLDGDKIADASAVTTVSGVTVAGQPATIDSTGIHVGPAGDSGAANAAVNSALSKLDASGISIRSLGATKSAKPSAVQAVAGGILVSFNIQANIPTVPVPNLPQPGGNYFGFVTLGGAGINAYAGAGQVLPNFSVPLTGAPGTTVAGAAPPAALPSGATAAGAPAQDPTVAAPPSHRANGLLAADLTYKKLRTLMLVLLAYPLLVLLSRPLRSPARLPRNA